MELAPFYVGQKVEATKNHHQCLEVKRGVIFIVVGIRKACNCVSWVIDIGIKGTRSYTDCYKCNYKIESNIWYFDSSAFRALEENFESISYSKVMEKESKLISVN